MILTGWKQIATHLGYGVRTVQRWERIGLPVKRVTKGAKSPVVADSDQLETWLLRRTTVRGGITQELWANIRSARELRGTVRGEVLDFLRAEIRLGLTMSQIAREAVYDDKRGRSRANARKAYDTVIRLIPKIAPTAKEENEIKRGLAQLKSALRQIGEKL